MSPAQGPSFGQYGQHFQKKVVQALLCDPQWAEQVSEVLEPAYFDLKYLSFLADRYLGYAKKYKAYPSLQMLVTIVRDELKQGTDIALREQVVAYLKGLRDAPDMGDLPIVKERSLDFCRRQSLKRALENILDQVEVGNYEQIVDTIKQAVSAGTASTLGHDLFEDVEARYVGLARSCVKTGLPELDAQKILNGGSGRGELHVMIAPTGVGKCVVSDTRIKIRYVAITINGKTYRPWDHVMTSRGLIRARDVEQSSETSISLSSAEEELTIGALFEQFKIESFDSPDGESLAPNEFAIDVESLDGYYPIEAFRMTKPEPVSELILSDGKSLQASPQHLVARMEGEGVGVWRKLEELIVGDHVSVEGNKLSRVKAVHALDRPATRLFDLQVGIAHSYSANGILSHNSHFLTFIGANAMRQGLNVLYYTFELSETKVGVRFDSNFTDIDSNDIMTCKEDVAKFYSENRLGKLKIKYFPTNEPTVQSLRAHVEKLALKGFVPDVILVDYADIMRSSRQYDLPRLELKLIYEELRAFAAERNVALWTASQSNKEGSTAEVVDMSNMSEAYAKAFIADFIVTLSRRAGEKASGLGRLYVAKNRNGLDGIVFPVAIDTARSKLVVSGEQTTPDEAKAAADQDVRQKLRDRFAKFNDAGLNLKKVG